MVSWTLTQGDMLKAMDGTYLLTDNGDGTTEVVYQLAVDVSIPMIGMIKRKAEKVIVDTALRGLKAARRVGDRVTAAVRAPVCSRPMRVLLFTGKGGVGKTTAAAGTAAPRGRGAADPGAVHRRGPLPRRRFGVDVPVGARVPVADRPVRPAGRRPAAVRTLVLARGARSYLLAVLDTAGVDPLEAEELTVLPGAEEVLALLEVSDQVRSGRWDVVVVDCAPTAETLRLLALPEALGWYMERIFPTERRVVRSLRPVLGRAPGCPCHATRSSTPSSACTPSSPRCGPS